MYEYPGSPPSSSSFTPDFQPVPIFSYTPTYPYPSTYPYSVTPTQDGIYSQSHHQHRLAYAQPCDPPLGLPNYESLYKPVNTAPSPFETDNFPAKAPDFDLSYAGYPSRGPSEDSSLSLQPESALSSQHAWPPVLGATRAIYPTAHRMEGGWPIDMRSPVEYGQGSSPYSMAISGPSVESLTVRSTSQDKGKGVEARGSWAEEFGKEGKRRREEETVDDVRSDTALLRTYLIEIVHLIRPFATTLDQPSPPVPPEYLRTRFARLSELIHTTLLSIQPRVNPTLSPEFTSTLPGAQSIAEKDMEIIRKRRDALNARAAKGLTDSPTGPAERNLLAGQSQSPVMLAKAQEGLEGSLESLGRCHGCGVSVTFGWRRGPDGPRSLCDSCGLHYEKLAKTQSGG